MLKEESPSRILSDLQQHQKDIFRYSKTMSGLEREESLFLQRFKLAFNDVNTAIQNPKDINVKKRNLNVLFG